MIKSSVFKGVAAVAVMASVSFAAGSADAAGIGIGGKIADVAMPSAERGGIVRVQTAFPPTIPGSPTCRHWRCYPTVSQILPYEQAITPTKAITPKKKKKKKKN